MPVVIQPDGILRNYQRMQATLHSVGEQASPHAGHKNRFMRGTIRLIDSDSLTFKTWGWEAVGEPVGANSTYHFAPIIILQEPGSSNIFSKEKLDALNDEDSSAKTMVGSAALYILDALICEAAHNRTLIDNTMILPATAPPTIERGVYRHHKGKEYLVEGLALAAGEEHLPVYAQHWSVIYRPPYGDYSLRTRPYAEFTEIVNRNDYDGPRFAFMRRA